jgi:hypothetical protein
MQDVVLLRRLIAAAGAAGLALLVLVLAAALAGGDGTAPPGPPVVGGVTTLADTPPPAVVLPAIPSPPTRAGPSWRTTEQRRLRRSRTVEGALRRAWLARRIDGATFAGYRGTWARARSAARRLPGARGAEQRAVVALASSLARERGLTSSRLAPVMLTLRRNTDFWQRRGAPRPGERFQFGRDPVVFRYEPGQGLHVHWLGTWGRANGRARFCLAKPGRCPRAGLERELTRLTALASRRAGYAAYESLYRFGGGAPGWVSGMTQGTAVQRSPGSPRARHAAVRPRGPPRARGLRAASPAGVRVRDGGCLHYLMYSFAPGLRILNGDLQAITGLHDMAELTGSRRARGSTAAGSGRRAPRSAASTRAPGRCTPPTDGTSSLGYHRSSTASSATSAANPARRLLRAAKRFTRYLREPTRIAFAGAGGRARAARPRSPSRCPRAPRSSWRSAARAAWRCGGCSTGPGPSRRGLAARATRALRGAGRCAGAERSARCPRPRGARHRATARQAAAEGEAGPEEGRIRQGCTRRSVRVQDG